MGSRGLVWVSACVVLLTTACGAPIPKTRVDSRDGLVYVWVSPGSSQLGCLDGDAECFLWELPAHQVEVRDGFWIGQTEVTQAAYGAVTGTNPSLFIGVNLPVERVSWHDAQTYCKAIGMRLPTEDEWELAARGGLSASRHGAVGEIAWYDGNSDDRTHAVGQKTPNPVGLYDMLGNVWEWVHDAYEEDESKRILRGGSFYNRAREVRVSNRLWALPDTAHRNMGFRCASD